MPAIAAAALFLAALAGCGAGTAKTTGARPPAASATAGLSIEQLKAAVTVIDGKLGCPSALVTSGSGYAQGGATADCHTPPTPADAENYTQSYFGIFVFPTAALRDAWITNAQGVGGSYAKGSTGGGYWAVQTSADDLVHVTGLLGGEIV